MLGQRAIHPAKSVPLMTLEGILSVSAIGTHLYGVGRSKDGIGVSFSTPRRSCRVSYCRAAKRGSPEFLGCTSWQKMTLDIPTYRTHDRPVFKARETRPLAHFLLSRKSKTGGSFQNAKPRQAVESQCSTMGHDRRFERPGTT